MSQFQDICFSRFSYTYQKDLYNTYTLINNEMNNRKVIKFGKTSYVVSLPIKWLRTHNLEKGSLLDVNERHSSLIISPTSKLNTVRGHVIIVNDDSDVLTLFNKIKSAYLTNYDVIRLKGTNLSRVYNDVIKILSGLQALEIVSYSEDEIVIKDYLDKDSIVITDVVLKSNLLLRKMFEQLPIIQSDKLSKLNTKDSSQKSEDAINNVILTDIDVNKSNNFILKLVNYKSNKFSDDTEKLTIISKISTYLELIGDELKRIARLKKSEEMDSSRIIKDVYEYYNNAFEIAHKFLNNENEDISSIVKLKDRLIKQIETEFDNCDGKHHCVILKKLKNITEFSFIFVMSAHVYKLG